jgi:leucine dehydrogenase
MISVFDAVDFDNHKEVVFVSDKDTGLKAIIAVHNTTLGPGLGGVRMWPYKTDQEALSDVLRLSKGMTYKAAIIGVKLGGAKSVIIGDARTQKTPELLKAMAEAIENIGGSYIAGEDIGTNPTDMNELRKVTKYVSCLKREDGGYGDPAPMTALGTVSAIKAGLNHAFNTVDLKSVHVAVQGVGNVGQDVCRQLHEAGAKLTITDVFPDVVERVAKKFGATIVPPDEIYDVDADIFAPCAIGSILNDNTIPRLHMKVIAGSANNQLAKEHHGERLAERGISYMPDYVANGGGLVSCAAEWYREGFDGVPEKVSKIFDTCTRILKFADAEGIATNIAANKIAEDRFQINGEGGN